MTWAGARGAAEPPLPALRSGESPRPRPSAGGGANRGKAPPRPSAPPPSRPRPGQGGGGWVRPTHARTLGDFVHAPRARTARRPPPRHSHSRRHHSLARPLRGRGSVLGGRFELSRLSLPPSPPHPLCLPTVPPSRAGPRGIEGAGSPRTQGPGRALWASCIFHRTMPGALRGVSGETGHRQSHGPPPRAQAPPAPPHLSSLTHAASLPPCRCVGQPPVGPLTQPWFLARLRQNWAGRGQKGWRSLGVINIIPADSGRPQPRGGTGTLQASELEPPSGLGRGLGQPHTSAPAPSRAQFRPGHRASPWAISSGGVCRVDPAKGQGQHWASDSNLPVASTP